MGTPGRAVSESAMLLLLSCLATASVLGTPSYHRKIDKILDDVVGVTPVEDIKEVTNIEEVKSITPIKSIKEVESIQEIKSIEKIKEHIARDFIKEHGLRNLIDDDDSYPMTAGGKLKQLEELKYDLKKDAGKCKKLKHKVRRLRKETAIMENMEDEYCSKAQYEIDEYKTLKQHIEEALGRRVDSIEPVDSIEEVKSITPIENIEEVKSMTPIENIEEVKSITPVESIQEVKHMYELTDDQAQRLKDLVLSQKWKGR